MHVEAFEYLCSQPHCNTKNFTHIVHSAELLLISPPLSERVHSTLPDAQKCIVDGIKCLLCKSQPTRCCIASQGIRPHSQISEESRLTGHSPAAGLGRSVPRLQCHQLHRGPNCHLRPYREPSRLTETNAAQGSPLPISAGDRLQIWDSFVSLQVHRTL